MAAYSKAFLLVGLLFAVTLFISSQVSARQLVEESATTLPQSAEESKIAVYFNEPGYSHPKEEEKDIKEQVVEDPQYYGYGGYGHGGGYGHSTYGGGHGSHNGGGRYGHGGSYGNSGYGHGGYGHGGYGGHYPPKEIKPITSKEKGN